MWFSIYGHNKILQEKGVGYVENRRFNLDWEKQGLNCPYEHCIETMPLHILEFGSSPKSCKLYGHECPGGEKQVRGCELEEMCRFS